jgi:DNA polymerase-1
MPDGGYAIAELTEQGTLLGDRRSVGVAELRAVPPAQRWLWASTADDYPALIAAGVHVSRCHDIAVVERILLGRDGGFGDATWPGAVVARAQGRPVPAGPVAVGTDEMPALFDLPGAAGPADTGTDPIELLGDAYLDQRRRAGSDRALALLLAAECASALAAAEMGAVGLPWRPDIHLAVLDELLGPRPPAGGRPRTLATLAGEIDAAFGFPVNPDSAVDVRAAFRRVGFDIDSTRSGVLKGIDHPAVPPLLQYKELSRLHTANGWSWLDQWVIGGRFHAEYLAGAVVSGRWATRGGGALQIPRVLRQAVVADPGSRLVVADAAQLEPRVLAAISGDAALQRISADVDLYSGLAADGFGGNRSAAKVAMLGAMYGQTTGEGGRLVGTLRVRYPLAMGYVDDAARAGERGEVVRSVLGRACPPPGDYWEAVRIGRQQDATDVERRRADRLAGDRGRFTRNFVVQASAADWAAVWLAGLRTGLADVPGAELVFFQHDELIVHVPSAAAERVAALIEDAADAARRMVFPGSAVATPVRPVIVERYAEAK